MPVAELPFDLVEVKLAAPQTRPGTVAKADVVARLSSSPLPFASLRPRHQVSTSGPRRSCGSPRLLPSMRPLRRSSTP